METSFISKKEIPKNEQLQGKDVREGVFKLIQKNFPNFTADDFISVAELNQYRRLYLTSLIP